MRPALHQQQQQARQACRDRALRRLAELYPGVLERLYLEECRKVRAA